jgi:MFS family permease
LASGVAEVVASRFVDRLGKGIRGAPRDALVADVTAPEIRGAAYGLRQSMDTIGAFAGPGIAVAVMALSGNNFRLTFWVAVLPAFLAVAVILFWVQEPERQRPATRRRGFPIRRTELALLGKAYWSVVAIAAVLTLARFSEAFLLLRAQDVGLAVALVPLILVVMNIAYAASAYPLGRLSDRVSRTAILGAGISLLILADIFLAAAQSIEIVLAGAVLWGLHMGATQGLLATLMADAALEHLRGTAFGVFHLVTGLTLLAASTLAGVIWSTYGPAFTFGVGAVVAAIALGSLLLQRR